MDEGPPQTVFLLCNAIGVGLINNNVCEPGRQAGWWFVIYYYYYDYKVKSILKRQMHDGGGECTKVSKELFENVVIDILV